MEIYTVFLTGLLTGGLTCMAVQGGLLAAVLAQRENKRLMSKMKKSGSLFPVLSFLISKLVAYTVLGFLLGFLGSYFRFSVITQAFIQSAVAVFMIGTALNILNIHPVFRYFVITPPKFLFRLLKNQSKSNDIFAPGVLGALTVFIPCGTTQAIMALALATADPFYSALIMFSFILGTSPLFFIFGFLAGKLNNVFQNRFMRVAAFAILILAVFNINNALSLSGGRVLIKSAWLDFSCTALSICPHQILAASDVPVTEATIYFRSNGYSPRSITVPKNSLVKLNLVNNDGYGCIQAFSIPKLNVQKIIRTGSNDTVEIKTPNTAGDISFSCSMGMYGGVIRVI
ncbi:hypothetical protein A3D05_01985 [Candidatus Gottesmanbacteria bacterium RIFCSPHIGHO2_02_FULL_40_24]|uniref:Urease accessory protein UreH-like transmembrane domain-containing protein n=1 Tax=Candidatus Gottesmanbacteria bacterium RIFCSPHIGHO2_01_FULL_40_15 TaxID=1798376 RepID=A0A1F5Z3W1_9BACT|nr:MAG: hypothetical protein A2777_04265 [Candidatus Gottesmanbacteria bacterium RIFCSPHIGHO2_01_FULL_40_15]OGG18625.1 MAG: hypothetical protein A3D05_01985 [Candidatus Gottesmanbacteria bacterium RIFCSPHIGHO2_02_FULL_40_24]OGG22829.1 MAG: hypothetical protein A3B48_05580 [Candidatus Gottesmanbacteria bacterium RIFCSPLOWO2_01_FULL_40_10]OGG24936.1 MAG: hypothetical protein A3E42_02790 [Candidatus Gottesmanbacteria bacterium RIFCSPHIGHO2_12_FULL_40_13]OGG31721.1 MAG: hypothetical protein A3I80_0